MNSEAIRYFRSAGISPRLPLPLPRSFDHGRRATRRENMICRTTGRTLRYRLLAAGIAAGPMFAAIGAANAGECPADKRGTDLTKMNATAAKGVSDTVLTAINLAEEPAKLQDRQL